MSEDISKIKRDLEEAKETIRTKDQKIVDLNTRIQDLQGKLDTLQIERPTLKPENLIYSFKTALEKMQEGLKISEGRVDYIVSKFDTDLKVNLTVDKEGEINFQLPKLEDIIPSENLSNLRLSIVPVPKAPIQPSEAVEVPNLIGELKDAALEAIIKAKLKVGKITERVSQTPPTTIIEQDPEPYSRTLVGSSIDLIISRIKEVKMPNLIGMDTENAIDTIKMSKLTVGKITEEISDSPVGTVISQSITADTLVPVETSIDVLIAKAEMVTVLEVIGKSIKDAKRDIEKARLKVGKITEVPSEKAKYTVITQSPEVGKEVPVRTLIDLVIARPRVITVPNVIGRPRESATKTLEKAELKVGKIIEKTSREPPGAVIVQKPEVGIKVPISTAVNITLSKAEMIVVPNLVGMERSQAKRIADRKHLRIEEITEQLSRKPKGMVLEQKPSSGVKVPTGTSLSLLISRGWRIHTPQRE